MIDPLLQEKIRQWRAKAIDKTITVEELQEAILAMRGARRAAGEASATAKSKGAKKSTKSADDMLSELEDL